MSFRPGFRLLVCSLTSQQLRSGLGFTQAFLFIWTLPFASPLMACVGIKPLAIHTREGRRSPCRSSTICLYCGFPGLFLQVSFLTAILNLLPQSILSLVGFTSNPLPSSTRLFQPAGAASNQRFLVSMVIPLTVPNFISTASRYQFGSSLPSVLGSWFLSHSSSFFIHYPRPCSGHQTDVYTCQLPGFHKCVILLLHKSLKLSTTALVLVYLQAFLY